MGVFMGSPFYWCDDHEPKEAEKQMYANYSPDRCGALSCTVKRCFKSIGIGALYAVGFKLVEVLCRMVF